MKDKVAAIILAAGKGTRMKSDLPKVMMPVLEKPMIRYIIDTLESTGIKDIISVIAPDGDMVREEVRPYKTAVQTRQLGTANAALAAKEELKSFEGVVLVMFGDNPAISKEVILKVIEKVRSGYTVVTLAVKPEYENRYGRLKTDGDDLISIIEYKDATEEERKIPLCNSDLMAFDGKQIFSLLEAVGNENASGEYYLTSVIEVARNFGLKCSYVINTDAIAGANTRADIALLEEFFRKKGC